MEEQSEQINTSSEIMKLFLADQKDREEFAEDSTKGLKIRQRDEQRLQKAKEIATRGKTSDPNELNMFAFIFQHGDTVEDYKQALNLTTQAVKHGLPPKNSLIPQATDRLMIQEQRDKGIPLNELRQKYGTQTRFDEAGIPIKPLLDGTVTKEEFKKFGIDQ